MNVIKRVLVALMALTLLLVALIPSDGYFVLSAITLMIFGFTVVRPAIEDMMSAREQSLLLPPAERKRYLNLAYIVNLSTITLVAASLAFIIFMARTLTT